MKEWYSGEFGTTYYYYYNDYGELGKTFITGKVKTTPVIDQILYNIREIKPVIFRTNNKAGNPNFRDTLLCCFHLEYQIGLNLGFKHLISAR